MAAAGGPRRQRGGVVMRRVRPSWPLVYGVICGIGLAQHHSDALWVASVALWAAGVVAAMWAAAWLGHALRWRQVAAGTGGSLAAQKALHDHGGARTYVNVDGTWWALYERRRWRHW